jgi:hypothetical protein
MKVPVIVQFENLIVPSSFQNAIDQDIQNTCGFQKWFLTLREEYKFFETRLGKCLTYKGQSVIREGL